MTETKAQQECSYCHHSQIIVNNDDTNVMIRFNCLFLVPKISHEKGSNNSDGSGQGISYCPMCGRKLGEDDAK